MTRRLLSFFTLALTGWLAAPGSLRADPTNPAPDFKEVYELLRTNLPGTTDGALNRAAVAGLVSQFPGKVVLVGGTMDGMAGAPAASALGKCAIIENNVAYLRVNRVTGNLVNELGAAGQALTVTNAVAGVVLDLRYASGEDYGAAQAAAKLLAGKKNARPFAGPLVVLVNGGTRGAAEALVVALRTTGAVLSLGSPTAGAAMTFKEFVLKDGERLLIAATPVKVDGKVIPAGGLQPDIAVPVKADDERVFWENPYGPPASGTNTVRLTTNVFLPFVDHTSEADLVRQRQKDGRLISPPPALKPVRGRGSNDDSDSDDDSPSPGGAGPLRPVLRDPVLARAVDLVKGLAAMREARP